MKIFLLTSLLFLFCLRVVGQLLVALYQVPFLPPMQEWQSGLLPYPVLVVCQIFIIGLFAKVCCDFHKRSGFFYETKKVLAEPLMNFGKIYVVANAMRFLIWTIVFRHHIWFSGTIPIVFHFVLASFLITVALHHRSEVARATISHPFEPILERQRVTQ